MRTGDPAFFRNNRFFPCPERLTGNRPRYHEKAYPARAPCRKCQTPDRCLFLPCVSGFSVFSGGPAFIRPAMTPSGMNRPHAVARHTAGDFFSFPCLFPFPCRANRPDGLPVILERIYCVQTGAARSGKAAFFCPAMSQRRLRPEKARQARPEKPRLFSARSRPKKFPAVSQCSFPS